MKTTYKFFELRNPDIDPPMGFFVTCTDETETTWFCQEIIKWVPSAGFRPIRSDVTTNKSLQVHINNLKKQDQSIVIMSIRLLCENGWKPLGLTQWAYDSKSYTFLKETNE